MTRVSAARSSGRRDLDGELDGAAQRVGDEAAVLRSGEQRTHALDITCNDSDVDREPHRRKGNAFVDVIGDAVGAAAIGADAKCHVGRRGVERRRHARG